jgi:hypothetical protein
MLCLSLEVLWLRSSGCARLAVLVSLWAVDFENVSAGDARIKHPVGARPHGQELYGAGCGLE